ncbi:hypothetical protein ACSZML_08660 [Aeromonas rivipollensis]
MPVIDRLLGLIVQVIRLIQPDQLARQATVIALARYRQGVAVTSRAEGQLALDDMTGPPG